MSRKNIKDWLDALLIAALLAVILYFLFWPVLIDSGTSMENTFFKGDRVIISRFLAYIDNIERGDIVLCKINYNSQKINAIKRIVGMPGDHIKIKKGIVYINDIEIEENYLKYNYTNGDIDIKLSDKEYYILGDNRKSSIDSRYFGPITKKEIVSKVLLKWYPFNDIKTY